MDAGEIAARTAFVFLAYMAIAIVLSSLGHCSRLPFPFGDPATSAGASDAGARP